PRRDGRAGHVLQCADGPDPHRARRPRCDAVRSRPPRFAARHRRDPLVEGRELTPNRPRSGLRRPKRRSRHPLPAPISHDGTPRVSLTGPRLCAERGRVRLASYPSGQRDLTVNQLSTTSGVRIPHSPLQKPRSAGAFVVFTVAAGDRRRADATWWGGCRGSPALTDPELVWPNPVIQNELPFEVRE